MKRQTQQREFVLRVRVIALAYQVVAWTLARATIMAHVRGTCKVHSHAVVILAGQELTAVSKLHAHTTATRYFVMHASRPPAVEFACQVIRTQETICCQVQPVICCH